MTAVRAIVVALNLVAGVLIGMAVVTIIGPDLGFPPRGRVFDILWVAFHIGPCNVLSALAVGSRWIGSKVLPVTLVAVTLVTAVPCVLVAQNEAATPSEGFSPLYGALTFAAVCVQYLVVLVTAAFIGIGWLWRRSRSPRPDPSGPVTS
jgi:hypothetical protein